MVDLAHHYGDAEVMCPVYTDDEGTPAVDVTMIDRGVLRGFLHSRETAARLGQSPTGNARAYGPDDEPLPPPPQPDKASTAMLAASI